MLADRFVTFGGNRNNAGIASSYLLDVAHDRLGSDDADFRPSLQVQHGIGESGDGAGDNVGDCDNRRTTFTRLTNADEGVCSLARLCDRNAERLWSNNGIAVAELGGGNRF